MTTYTAALDTHLRRASARITARIAGVAGAILLTSALSGCFGGTTESTQAAPLPNGFPDSIPVNPSAVIEASTEPGNIWRIVLKADGRTERDDVIEELTNNGFAITGSSGEDIDQIYSLANSEYSLRVSFDENDDGTSIVLLTAATHTHTG